MPCAIIDPEYDHINPVLLLALQGLDYETVSQAKATVN
jgi:hypothetical protein